MLYVILGTLLVAGLVVVGLRVAGRRALAADAAATEARERRRAAAKPKPAAAVPAAPAAPVGPVWVVMLLKRPRVIDEDRCRRCAERAWGVTITPGVPDAADRVETIVPEAQYAVSAGGHEFKVQKRDKPFALPASDPAAALVPNPLPEHKAYLTVGMVGGQAALGVAYPLLGTYVVELSGRDPSHVLIPGAGLLVAYDDDAKAALRAADPIAALGALRERQQPGPGATDPAAPPPAADSRVTGTAEAKRRWPEFVAAYQAHVPGRTFRVNARLTDGARHEHLWVDVSNLKEGVVYGTVADASTTLTRPRQGDHVRVQVKDVADWLILDGATRTGGFTTAPPNTARPLAAPPAVPPRRPAATDDDDTTPGAGYGRITLD